MARKGITESDVATALAELRRAGLASPSIRMIHQKLGQGSLTTISRHKRAIDSEQRSAGNGLPDAVHAAIVHATQTIWDELSEAADAAIASAKADAQQAIGRYRDAEALATDTASSATTSVQTLTSQLKETEAVLSDATGTIETLGATLSTESANKVTLAAEKQQLEERCASLTQHITSLEATQARQNRRSDTDRQEHTTSAKRWDAQHETMQHALDKQAEQVRLCESAQATLNQQFLSLRELTDNLKQEKQSWGRELTSVNKAHNATMKALGAMESNLTAERAKNAMLEKLSQAKAKIKAKPRARKTRKPKTQ